MFKFLLLIAAFLLAVVWPLTRCDEKGYAALVKSSEPKEMRAFCQQFREGVTKNLWGDQACQIASDHSELFFFSQSGDIELIEEIDALTCIVQEECYMKEDKPFQRVRLLKAKEASFNYNTQLLKAHDVQMWTYELPGHTPPKEINAQPIMQGTAGQIELKMEGKQFDITAHQFNGRMT